MNRLKLSLMALVLVPALNARAQSTTGLSVGAQVTGAALNFRNATQKVDFGGGWGVHVGLGLSESWTVQANYDHNSLGSSGGNYDLGQWDLLLRANLMEGAPLRPYFAAGVTGRAAKSNSFEGSSGSYSFSGMAPTAGGGIQLFLTPSVALDGGASWTFGNFTSVENNGSSMPGRDRLDATGTRVMVGASIFLFGGKN